MNAFNRVFAVTVGLLWIAAWAGVIYLMWEPAREVEVNNRYIQMAFDLSVTGSDRVLGTLIASGAIILGVGLIMAQAIPARSGRRADYSREDPRYRDLHERLDSLQRRVDDREMTRRPVSPDEPVLARETPRPNSERRWGIFDRSGR